MDVIQRLKIPMKLVLGFGTGSMRDLNTFLRPALDNNQISKEEDQAIRDYRRRYSNRRSQGKLTFLRDRTGCVFLCFPKIHCNLCLFKQYLVAHVYLHFCAANM